MWELDYKKGWALKNWFFWTVVLDKTLESPLNSKEIQPVHPKGNQSWIFTGRTDAEAEVPIFWPPDMKNWLIWKDSDAENYWRQEEKGTIEDELVGLHHWFNGHDFGHALGSDDGQRRLVYCSPWGHKESDTTEQLNWTELYNIRGPPHPSTITCHDSFLPTFPGFQSILPMNFCGCYSFWLWSPFPAVSFKTFTVNFTTRSYPTFSSSMKTYFLFLRRFSCTVSVPIVTVNVLLLNWNVTVLKVLFTYVSHWLWAVEGRTLYFFIYFHIPGLQ